MKKKITCTILSTLLFSSCLASPALTVSQVSTQPTSINKQNYNLTIDFTLKHAVQAPWAIGFYMPRTMRTLGSVNPNLTIKLTGASNTNLHFLEESKHTSVYGTGYTNVVIANNASKSLKPGKYQLSFTSSNQWAPGNLYSMPQHFFIADAINSAHPHFIQATIKIKAYHLGGYQPSNIQQEITATQQQEIKASLPIKNKFNQSLNLVPMPKQLIKNKKAALSLNTPTATLSSHFINQQNRQFLKTYLKQGAYIHLKKQTNSKLIIQVSQAKNIINPEAYRLQISPHKIQLAASTQAGVFYGLQTLRQLFYYAKHHQRQIPALTIIDAPRFHYRGVMLDLARHNFIAKGRNPLAHFENFIRLMAALKLNTLHLHFSDDEGWRLALNVKNKKVANALANKASLRGFVPGSVQPTEMFEQANLDISNHTNQNPSNPSLLHRRYPNANSVSQSTFTQAEITRLIHYANARQITIIPEIDLPGHARALVQSLPSFQDANDLSQYLSVQGYSQDVIPVCRYNQNNAFTQQLNQIIHTISRWFSHQTTLYAKQDEVSVGGDEVSADAWTKDHSCLHTPYQGLSALAKSQYFFKQLQAQTHIVLSGWQQVIQSNDTSGHGYSPLGKNALSANHTGHIWVWETSGSNKLPNANDPQGGIHDAALLAQHNYPIVLAFADDSYFDLTYSPNKWEPGFYWSGGFVNTFAALKLARDASSVSALLTTQQKQNLLGLEGTLWSENLNNYHHLIYMAAPKITGLAEAAWSSSSQTNRDQKIDWLSLAARLGTQPHQGLLNFLQQRILGKNYYRGYPNGISDELPKLSARAFYLCPRGYFAQALRRTSCLGPTYLLKNFRKLMSSNQGKV